MPPASRTIVVTTCATAFLLAGCAELDSFYDSEYSHTIRFPQADSRPSPEGCPACAAATPLTDVALLEKPPRLRPGIGEAHEAIASEDGEAKAFHDQGLAWLHSYGFIEAARCFRAALGKEPRSALSEVGLARALQSLELRAQALAALDRAQALAKDGPDHARTHAALRRQQIEAATAPEAEQRTLHAKYKAALDDALAAFPDDVELWLMRGNAEEPSPAGKGQRGTAAALAFYEKAQRLAPRHPGPVHYLTHCYENLSRFADAAKHAEAYVALAQEAPHAHHMRGHVLPRVGRWDDALAAFREAERLEDELARQEGYAPGDDWHHGHNLKLLGWAAAGAGKADEAERAFRALVALPIRPGRYAQDHVSLAEFWLYAGRTQEALDAARELAKSKVSGAMVAGHEVAAEALAALGKPAEAQQELDLATKAGGGKEPQALFAKARIGLRGDAEARAAAERSALELANAVRAAASFDAYGPGLFRLRRLAADCKALGLGELAQKLARE